MILGSLAIEAAVADGSIRIDPYNPDQLNPASYDLTLGDELCVYVNSAADRRLEGQPVNNWYQLPDPPAAINVKQQPHAFRALIDPEKGFRVGWTQRRRVFLMHTRERIWTLGYVPVIDGKSSIGRLGLAIHITAGYGDPGFDGQYTLEVVALGEDVILFPGMRIAQVRFHQVHAQRGYRGNYTGAAAMGAQPSKSYAQFTTEAKTDPAPAPVACLVCSNPWCDNPNGKH